ncbi:MAG TPA: hypothetical protein VHG51_17100, partial [Longimicrobiaceae bacterium]|nr:hypothetical protein [Longimicrobiaceae bacterium]
AVTRTIGVVLLPTLLATLVLRSRRPLRAALLCAGAGAVLLAAALALAPEGSGYLRQLRDLAASRGAASLLPDAEHVRRTGFAVTDIWAAGASPWTGRAAALAAALLAAVGIAPRLRRVGAAELFVLFYLAAVFLWPASQARYFVPVLPLWVLYAVAGAERLVRGGRPAARAAAAVAALPVAAAYVVGLGTWEAPGATGTGVGPGAAGLYGHVRAHTPPDARFVTAIPRSLALFTGRAAAPPSRDGSDAEALAFMEGARIGYVALRAGEDLSRGLVERNPARFERVYAAGGHEVFRLLADSVGAPE